MRENDPSAVFATVIAEAKEAHSQEAWSKLPYEANSHVLTKWTGQPLLRLLSSPSVALKGVSALPCRVCSARHPRGQITRITEQDKAVQVVRGWSSKGSAG